MSNAKDIRNALKNQLGLTSQDVSVRSSRGAIRVEIKIPTAKGPIEEIARMAEHVDRCEFSGEILAGGNTFVFVDYSDSALDGIVDVAAIEALGDDGDCLTLDRVQIDRDDSGGFVVWDIVEESGVAHRVWGATHAARTAAQILLGRAA